MNCQEAFVLHRLALCGLRSYDGPPNAKQRLNTPPLLQLLFYVLNKFLALRVDGVLGVE
jgi:hypothetical protein